MNRCGWQPFLPAEDMGNRHPKIVHDYGQVIGRHAISLEQALVVYQRGIETDRTADHVFERDGLAGRHFDPDNVWRAAGKQSLGFVSRQAERITELHPVFMTVSEVRILPAV